MIHKTNVSLALVVMLGSMLAHVAVAQYAIPTSVFSGGASKMSGTAYGISGTIGQPAAGPTIGAAYDDLQGFWYGARRSGASAAGDAPALLPSAFSLKQNYPNPFNPTTQIRFEVPNTARVTIKAFNINGQLVETLTNQEYSAGEHVVNWNADRHASGVYLIRMSAPGFSDIRRALLLK